LRAIADEHKIATPQDAVSLGLIDGLKYDDQLREELLKFTSQKPDGKLNLVNIAKYAESVDIRKDGKDKIALIYAQGNIVDGKGQEESIGSESYRNIIRKARLDKSIKAIVFRVNSGGGSALASENIWRELTLARKEKPVVLSFGDVAASGGYYLSCNADSIFAQPNTITGSIGVFSLLPNMQKFFNNKLGVTFDGVRTGPSALGLNITAPLTDLQKKWLQADVDSIYYTFTKRVADGRKLNRMYVDSIGQGRIWSGTRALKLGLVDKLGGLQDAIDCAARMSKTSDYRLREFPEPVNFIEKILGNYQENVKTSLMKEELGEEGLKAWNSMKEARAVMGSAQTRLPFEFYIR
jgi:protease-4